MGLGDERDPLAGADEEILFHLERQVEDLKAEGWSESAARAEARRRFGDPDRIARYLERMGRRRRTMARAMAWWDGSKRDVAFTFRQMRRRPAFAAATVVVLALGVGMASAVFGVVDAALVRPLPFPDPSALVSIEDVQSDEPGYPASFPEYRDWTREGAQALRASVAFVTNQSAVRLGDVPENVTVGRVAGDLIGASGLAPILGRSFTDDERNPAEGDIGVVMMDEDFWRTRMGADPGVVGGSIEVDGTPIPVVGVMPREARLLFRRPDVVLWRPFGDLPWLTRGDHFLSVVGRLADDVDVAAARPRIEALAAGLREAGVTRHGIVIQPLRERLLGDGRRMALVLAGAAVLVLLVVCANLAHLSLARGWGRGREFAVRGALGAGRGALARQLLIESTLLGLVGGAAGLLVARALTGWVARAAAQPAVAALAEASGWRVVAFALFASVLLGLLFGWLPARAAAGADPGTVLRGGTGSTGAPGRQPPRRVLVGLEVALSTVLLVGAGLLVRTVDRLLHQDVGFRAGGVLTASVDLTRAAYDTPEARLAFWGELTERLRALPGVRTAALSSHLPFRGDTNGGFEIVGREFPEGESPYAKKRFVGTGFFEAMDVPVVRGRGFLPSDRRGGPEVALISEAVAERYWPGEDPIGRRIRFLWQTEEEQEIVGVVGDVRTDALDIAAEGTIYLDNDQIARRSMAVVIRSDVAPETLREPLRRLVRSLDPEQPVSDIRTLDSIVRDSMADRTAIMQLLAAFAVLALLLAAVGVYAIAAQTVLSRTREIGLRVAVGARPERVVRHIVGQEMLPVLIGLAAGLIVAAATGRVLAGMLYGVSPRDLPTMVSVALVLLVASIAALVLPALRAVRVDPSVALRVD